jgi:hypothetical protein
MRSPLLNFHICGGIVGLLSGAVAMSFRKGSNRHAIAGNIFVAAMIGMASAGVLLAVMKAQPGNILGGLVTCYLVATAWRTARRKEGAPGMVDWGALLVAATLCAVEITFGTQAALSPTGLRYHYPPGPYFMMGSIMLLAAIGDVRVIVHRGISGTQRLARHLWRMCFALFIASASVFLARQHLFPVWMRKGGLLILLALLPLLLMFFWLIRVRFASSVKQKLLVHAHA